MVSDILDRYLFVYVLAIAELLLEQCETMCASCVKAGRGNIATRKKTALRTGRERGRSSEHICFSCILKRQTSFNTVITLT